MSRKRPPATRVLCNPALNVGYVRRRMSVLLDSLNKGNRLRGDRYIIALLCDWLAGRRREDSPSVPLRSLNVPQPPDDPRDFAEMARLHYKAYLDEEPDGQFVEAAMKRLAELGEEQEE